MVPTSGPVATAAGRQTIKLHRTVTVDNAPALLSAGEPAIEISPTYTKVWAGDGSINRLLLSTNPGDSPAFPTTGGPFLPLVGGTLSGNLNFSGGNGISYNLASLPGAGVYNNQIAFGWNGTSGHVYVSVDGTGNPGALANHSELGNYLPLVGGVLSGPGNLTVGGTLYLSGPYIYFSGATTGAVNGVGGPLIFGDDNWLVPKLGSGNLGLMLQDYDGGSIVQMTRANGITVMQGTPSASSTTHASFSPSRLQFRILAGDDTSAGQIDYRGHNAAALGLVGAGVSPDRLVYIWDNLGVGGTVSAASSIFGLNYTINGTSNFIYADGGGSLIFQSGPLGAPHGWLALFNNVMQYNGVQVARIYVTGSAPTVGATHGDLWWDDISGQLFIRYSDPTSTQWVLANVAEPGPPGPAGPEGPPGAGGPFLPLTGGGLDGRLIVNGWIDGHQLRFGDLGAPWAFHSPAHNVAELWSNISGNGKMQWHGDRILSMEHIMPSNNDGQWCGVDVWGHSWHAASSHRWNTASDPALKNEITPVTESVLDKIVALCPVSFRWNSDPPDRRHHRGFLAPDVRDVMGPDFAGYNANDDPTIAGPLPRNADLAQYKGHQSIDYNELLAVLWRGVQELTAEVRALKANGKSNGRGRAK
jgi:hypothetical protein